MLKNKKGQVSELMQDSVCLIVIVLLLILFFVVSGTVWGWSRNTVESSATLNSLQDQSHYSLQAFLQKPVEVEIEGRMHNITMADLIRLSKIDPAYENTYENIIKMEAEEDFDQLYYYIFRTTNEELEAHIGALETFEHPRFFVPAKKPILVVLQIDKIKEAE